MIIEDGFKQLREASRTGLMNIRSASGVTNDPEVIRYQRLRPEHFDVLVARFGQETVTGYIHDMERRKFREGR